MNPARFQDRAEAGRRLAAALEVHAGEQPIVLGLPRGGVPVAYEVARALGAPLDVWVVRKVGVPWQPELGVGAVAEGDAVYLSEDMLAQLALPRAALADAVAVKRREVAERVRRFRGDRPAPTVRGQTVLLVDDGIATGGTVRAAILALRALAPRRLVLAVPVAAAQAVAELAPLVDRVVALLTPADLQAIGLWYEDFTQVSDDEVVELLERARRERAMDDDPASEAALHLPVGSALLDGDLALPAHARGLVVFAHGSGSSRYSPRNLQVAEALRARGLGTLLFDLLTPAEEHADDRDAHLRFDIPLLGDRLVRVLDWLAREATVSHLPLGLFGASTGAAAALHAAANRPAQVQAVVSRGGRPDLAPGSLPRVLAPTLLIVGGEDDEVLQLNRAALARLGGPAALAVVPGASHLFVEPGALEDVARRAGDWFERHLVSRAAPLAVAAAGPVSASRR